MKLSKDGMKKKTNYRTNVEDERLHYRNGSMFDSSYSAYHAKIYLISACIVQCLKTVYM